MDYYEEREGRDADDRRELWLRHPESWCLSPTHQSLDAEKTQRRYWRLGRTARGSWKTRNGPLSFAPVESFGFTATVSLTCRSSPASIASTLFDQRRVLDKARSLVYVRGDHYRN